MLLQMIFYLRLLLVEWHRVITNKSKLRLEIQTYLTFCERFVVLLYYGNVNNTIICCLFIMLNLFSGKFVPLIFLQKYMPMLNL